MVSYCLKMIRIPAWAWDDCKQEGLLALWEVAKNYNPKFGNFSSYAVPYITGRMRGYIRKNKVQCKYPRNVVDKATELMNYATESGKDIDEVGDGELALLGISQTLLNDIKNYIAEASLDAPISVSDEDSFILSDVVPSKERIEDVAQEDFMLDTLEEFFTWVRESEIKEYTGTDIFEHYIYMAYMDETPTTCLLADIFNVSQSYISRILMKWKKLFYMWLTSENRNRLRASQILKDYQVSPEDEERFEKFTRELRSYGGTLNNPDTDNSIDEDDNDENDDTTESDETKKIASTHGRGASQAMMNAVVEKESEILTVGAWETAILGGEPWWVSSTAIKTDHVQWENNNGIVDEVE